MCINCVTVCVCECRKLSNNKLSSVLDESSPLFIGLSSLSSLDLAANQIKSLSRHAFDGLDSLRHLDLTGNNISSLQDETFTQLRNLHTMSVSLCVCLCVCLSVCLSVGIFWPTLYFGEVRYWHLGQFVASQ